MTDVDGGATPASPSTGVVDGGTASGTDQPWTTDVMRVRDQALAVLKLTASDPAAPRIGQAATVAVEQVNAYLDRVTPFTIAEVPASVIEAATTVAVEVYRRKDAPFGVLGAWSTDGESMRIARDALAGVTSLLAPYRGGWGLA